MLAVLLLLGGIVLVPIAVITAAGAVRRSASPRLGPARDAIAHLTDDLGPIPAALCVGAAGCAALVAVCWPLGLLAAHLEGSDRSTYDWVLRHQAETVTRVMKTATLMGNRFEIKIVIAITCIGFAVFLRRRAVLPIIAVVGSFVVERYLQKILSLVVHRGHPPTTLGTFPSGGCGRLIGIYGLILYLVLRYWRPGRRVVVAAWGTLSALAWIEGYSRIYLEKHWATDVYTGWIFGLLLLGTFVLTTSVLLGERRRPQVPPQPRVVSDQLWSGDAPVPREPGHAQETA